MKKQSGVNAPQNHLQSRISYLYQAAAYLTEASIVEQEGSKAKRNGPESITELDNSAVRKTSPSAENPNHLNGPSMTSNQPENDRAKTVICCPSHTATKGLARQLISQLRAVSLKGQIRLSPTIKHSVCRRCEAFLMPGSTSIIRVENKSRGGKKPWSDVLLMTCNACGTEKRFPIGADRQRRRTHRVKGVETAGSMGVFSSSRDPVFGLDQIH
ncbi:hypothetical protein MMC24_005973 [Lignoscripta atroalba]|nr:hypothetical protein [Lignoscripta atroalba]